MSRIGAAFSRLSKREKIMVAALALVVLGSIFFLLQSSFQGKINRLEGDIAAEQEALRQIYGGTEQYLVAARRFKATRERAEENASLTLTTAVSGLADAIIFEATDGRNNPLGQKHLKEFLEYNALRDKPIVKKKEEKKDEKKDEKTDEKKDTKPSAAKGAAGGGYVQRDQEFTLKGTVPFAAIYELFEKIEESSDMLFVTEVKLDKNALDSERADNVKFTVSTYFYVPENKEETP